MNQFRARHWLILQALFSAMAAAQTIPSTQAISVPPPYTIVRYNEDYSYLKNPSLRTDPFDRLKYIPLNSDGDWYASLGAQIRDRYEWYNNYNFGSGPQDNDGFNLLRVTASADVHMGDFRMFVQGYSATENGRDGGPRSRDVDEYDIHQGFVDWKMPLDSQSSFTLRGGREELQFGAQRLVSPSDWSNIGRAFDGVRGTLRSPHNQLDIFVTEVMQNKFYQLNNDIPRTYFAGVYDTWTAPGDLAKSNTKVELYTLYVRRPSVKFASEGPAAEDRYTVGGRISGNPKPFDYEFEPDYQFGAFNGGNIGAYSIGSTVGYTFSEVLTSPRIFLEFNLASGDHGLHNGTIGTWDQLFLSNHLYVGYIEAIGRQNLIDLRPGMNFTLLANRQYVQKLMLTGEYHIFWRDSNSDAVYTTSQTVLRSGTASSASYIGSELDLIATWQIDRHSCFEAGWGHFFAGEFIKETGAHGDIDFVYCSFTYTF